MRVLATGLLLFAIAMAALFATPSVALADLTIRGFGLSGTVWGAECRFSFSGSDGVARCKDGFTGTVNFWKTMGRDGCEVYIKYEGRFAKKPWDVEVQHTQLNCKLRWVNNEYAELRAE